MSFLSSLGQKFMDDLHAAEAANAAKAAATNKTPPFPKPTPKPTTHAPFLSPSKGAAAGTTTAVATGTTMPFYEYPSQLATTQQAPTQAPPASPLPPSPAAGIAAGTATAVAGGYGATSGSLDVNGWTVFNATVPVSNGYNATNAGTNIIYVSSGTGNDANAGTISAPVATLAHGMSLLRNGMPDWLLLKRGDVWVSDGSGNNFGSIGSGVNINGVSAAQPIVIGSYDPSQPGVVNPYVAGARPQVQTTGAWGASALTVWTPGATEGTPVASGSFFGDYIAMTGIEFYAAARDPSNVAYDPYWAHSSISAIVLLNMVNWSFFEDCKFSFYTSNIGVNVIYGTGPGGTGPADSTLTIRRCVAANAYTTNGTSTGYSEGVYLSGFANYVIEDNCFDENGWNSTLTAPQTVTISIGSPATITFPASNTTSTLYSGAGIILATTGALPTGITATPYVNWYTSLASQQIYYLLTNTTGTTWTFSATSGGTPVVTSGSQSGVHSAIWNNGGGDGPSASSTLHQRNLYLEANQPWLSGVAQATVLFNNNISTRSSSEAFQLRPGGTCTNNLVYECPIGPNLGGTTAQSGFTVTPPTFLDCSNNVVQAGIDRPNVPLAWGFYAMNCSGAGCQITNNIVSQVMCDDPQATLLLDNECVGVVVTNNIVYNWPSLSFVQDLGTGNTTSGNYLQQSGYPFPNLTVATYDAGIGGPGTFDDFIAQAKLQSKVSPTSANAWNPALTATAVNAYIASGFGLTW